MACAADAPEARRPPTVPPEAISLAELNVETGEMQEPESHRLRILGPAMRATLQREDARAMELRFTYRGPNSSMMPLASGEERRQIGLKLRARDTCNVLYVMWHIEPSLGLHVSVKSNPSETLHSQCGDHGYRTLLPSVSADIAPIVRDQPRTLSAKLESDLLNVYVDGVVAWSGRLPPEALELDGPFGIRSDNGRFDLQMSAYPELPSSPGSIPRP